MAVIVDLFPVLPRRSYLSRPRHLDAERVKGPRRRSASVKANAPLDCLSGGALASRFHGWHGRSGRRYVCSVFPVDLDDPSAGLPELGDAVVIAVGFDRRRERFPIAIFEISATGEPLSFGRTARDAALAAGIREWHIHLLAESDAARRAVIFDLEETRHS